MNSVIWASVCIYTVSIAALLIWRTILSESAKDAVQMEIHRNAGQFEDFSRSIYQIENAEGMNAAAISELKNRLIRLEMGKLKGQ